MPVIFMQLWLWIYLILSAAHLVLQRRDEYLQSWCEWAGLRGVNACKALCSNWAIFYPGYSWRVAPVSDDSTPYDACMSESATEKNCHSFSKRLRSPINSFCCHTAGSKMSQPGYKATPGVTFSCLETDCQGRRKDDLSPLFGHIITTTVILMRMPQLKTSVQRAFRLALNL